MNKQEPVRAFAIAAVALLGLSLNTSILSANDTGVRDKRATFDRIPWTGPRELQLWIVSNDNGFQVLRFADDFMEREKSLKKSLFEDSVE